LKWSRGLLSGGVLLVLPTRPHKLRAALLPIHPAKDGEATERVDHDVVGAVCALLSSVLLMEYFHVGSCPTLRQARPTFDRVH
jgi:hypothetical protein